ncbi:MAG: molybdopterin-dependent oxidoreductase [Coriobacteriales bacterium]|nr:molybdopterin-dependent oxidoreductase [Coriobacteriales bacterium]
MTTIEDVQKCERYPKGERIVSLTPDPSRYPYSEQITNGCQRWRMHLSEIDGAMRINYPLKRVAGTKRGGNQWERVSWDAALDDIAIRLQALANKYGPQTLATAIGGPHATYWPLHRFMNLWGSPNNMGIGQICWNIRIWMDALAYGWPIEVNIDPATTGQIFLWGTNPAQSDNSLFWRTLQKMARAGTPLVVIDPRKTQTAKLASLHLAPRPGTDCVLALALIREIIATGRTNDKFISKWCHGYDELVAHVQPYTLKYAESITSVRACDIASAAAIFSADSPTALLSGRGIDQLGPNTAPTHRALSILRAITGDVDRQGACQIMEMSDFIPEVDLEMSAQMTPEQRATQLNIGYSSLQSYTGYEAATALTSRLGKTAANPKGNRLPMRYLASAHPNLVLRAALKDVEKNLSSRVDTSKGAATEADTGTVHLSTCKSGHGEADTGTVHLSACKDATTNSTTDSTTDTSTNDFKPPYRVSALICMGANPLVTYADISLVHKALHALDLLVVLEYYMTPTAQLADYVLPIAGALERPLFQAHGGVANFAYGGTAALAPYYERRTDYEFWRELGCRLGQTEHWPDSTLHDAIGRTLAPANMTLDDWCERGIYAGPLLFNKHELLDENGNPQGFATTTGKLELANEFLAGLGSSRLPKPVLEILNFPNALKTEQELSDSQAQKEKMPTLTLITGARKQPYWASSYFNNPEFRKRYPLPQADMSAATLALLNIKKGDWVMVRTAHGEAKFVANEAELLDGVVSVDYGWWFPEEEPGEPHLSGAMRSNANMLTSADASICEPLIGTWTYNGIACVVSAV